MNLKQIIDIIEDIARKQPAVNEIVGNNIYDLNDKADSKFAVFGWTQESHSEDVLNGHMTYNFVFFYVDRLTHDEKNRINVQSTGIEVLSNIIKGLVEEGFGIQSNVNYTTFNQRFSQDCTGVMARVSILTNTDGLCNEQF